MRFAKTYLLFMTLALGVAACAPLTVEPQAQPEEITQPTLPAADLPNAEAVATPLPVEAAPVLPLDSPPVQSAVADLSTQLGVAADEITVLRAEPVIWSDGSLGCPQPDMMYTQALVDGVFIQLQVGDAIYSYHGGGSQDPFLCESAAPVAPGELPPGATGSSAEQ